MSRPRFEAQPELRCSQVHEEYDRYANGEVQLGQLPNWMRVNGKVAWYVFEGPYSGLSEGWLKFMEKAHKIVSSKLIGPPGDVYVCDPEEHKGRAQETMITILWAPVKD